MSTTGFVFGIAMLVVLHDCYDLGIRQAIDELLGCLGLLEYADDYIMGMSPNVSAYIDGVAAYCSIRERINLVPLSALLEDEGRDYIVCDHRLGFVDVCKADEDYPGAGARHCECLTCLLSKTYLNL